MFKDLIKYIIRRSSGYYATLKDIKKKAAIIVSEKGSMLDKEGFLHGTDKSSLYNSGSLFVKGHDYLRHYELFFGQYRNEKFSLLEFGCQKGNSLRTWEQFFPLAEIYGVDLDESTKQSEKGRVHVVIGNATSQEVYDKIKSEINSALIIIDDASHAWGDQRRSFELFWDLVTPGGFYVIEDLFCGAMGVFPEYPPEILDSQPFFNYMQDRCEFLRWATDEGIPYRSEQLPPKIQQIEREMDMCVFIPGAVIVRKKA